MNIIVPCFFLICLAVTSHGAGDKPVSLAHWGFDSLEQEPAELPGGKELLDALSKERDKAKPCSMREFIIPTGVGNAPILSNRPECLNVGDIDSMNATSLT